MSNFEEYNYEKYICQILLLFAVVLCIHLKEVGLPQFLTIRHSSDKFYNSDNFYKQRQD